MYSCLKRRKQSVKINDTESVFQILLSGIPQGSVLDPTLFNIFINGLFKDVELANFADENTIYAARNSTEEPIEVLQKESKPVIDWFKMNDMIVNSDKLQAIIMNCNKNRKQTWFEYK